VDSPIKKMLVYIDGTEQSITAAQYALYLSKFTGARLTAFYVVNTKALDDLLKSRIFLKEEQVEYEHDLEEDAQRYLNHVKELARGKGIALETRSAMGNPSQELVKLVREEGFDLLVIGELSHMRSRRDEFFDQTERAMRAVACSVLIVKNDDFVWELFESLG
jgi:nucleotide-binding universal stress UspA family protein